MPPRGSAEGGGGGGDLGAAAGRVGGSTRGGWSGGGNQGTLGEKVVARALECLERLCCSEDCERFMTPLAREVRFAFAKKRKQVEFGQRLCQKTALDWAVAQMSDPTAK